MDLIDRERFIYSECGSCGMKCDLPECACPSIERLLNADSCWSPCSERMPEKEKNVLVLFNTGEICVMKLCDDGRWTGCRGVSPYWASTHWMPLPEPPKGGAENE